MNANIPEMLTIRDVASRTGISYEAIRYLCATGQIPCIRVGRQGGKYLVNFERFVDFLNVGDQRNGDTESGEALQGENITPETPAVKWPANERVRVAMQNHGLKQWEVADLLGISEFTLSRRMRCEMTDLEQDLIVSLIEKKGGNK